MKNRLIKNGPIFFALIYLAIVFIDTAPNSVVPAASKRFASQLLPGFLGQSWGLFAPPPSDQNLLYRYKTDQKWSKWIEPLKNEVKKHQKYRVTYHRRLCLSLYNLSWWVQHYPENEQRKESAVHYLNSYTKFRYGVKPQDIEYKILTEIDRQ